MAVINSLLDTDFYTFTMLQVVLHQYPGAMARFSFKWRNWDDMHLHIPVKDFQGRLKKELDNLCSLRFTKEELQYLNQIPYFKPGFIEYLRLFQMNRLYIKTNIDKGTLGLDIYGPLISILPFEVPVLSIISELYTNNCGKPYDSWLTKGRKNLTNKLSMLTNTINNNEPFRFADFGTRRRASKEFHSEVIANILDICPQYFVGTSNVMYAMKYGIKPIGTMSHAFLQAHQQLGPRLVDSQQAALQSWANEYRGELGIALSDVIGFEAFKKDFDRYFALLFDGCRHDSGDPEWWANGLIEHYKKLRIDPKTKYAVFSDGLTFEKAIDLYKKFNDKIHTSFGIGTYLTNDCCFKAPQIVIKMVECNGKPVAKISDSKGKGMCMDNEYLNYLNKIVFEKVNN